MPAMPISDDESWEEAAETLTIDDPQSSQQAAPDPPVLSPTASISTNATMPAIPELPAAPPPLNVSYIEDAATRKLVEKEHHRAVKAYEKAVKDREKVIRDRARLEEKRERKTRKDSEKSLRDAGKAKQKAEKDALKANQKEQKRELTQSEGEELRLASERERMEAEGRRLRGEKEPDMTPENPVSTAPPAPQTVPEEAPTPPLQSPSTSPARDRSPSGSPNNKPKKDRKFCSLPPKDSNGERDPLWVRIFMENVDEVGAHCGLFFIDERYERLVGEVADRVEGWAREDLGVRVVDEKRG
jgi:hypothetical protein